ncbi:MAG: long-chain fatty acid--CoA ligase [Desulfobacteraceae bacterium]|nr:long-chain fatty acid--CoA ligase [Desulfobacteraceae bacterium]
MYAYNKPDNLVSLIEYSINQYADLPYFGTKQINDVYTWRSYGQVGKRIDDLRAGLADLGISPNDSVGIIANNRLEWAVAAFATFGLKGRFIPMYEKELPHIWQHIIKDGKIKALFVGNTKLFDQIKLFRSKTPDLKHVFIIDGQGQPTMADLEAVGRKKPISSIRPDPQTIAALIYTSGTTGHPKGVLLTHGNFTSNVNAAKIKFPEITSESRSLSILPWAHSYGQTAELYTFSSVGASIGFIEKVTTIAEDMVKVRPTILIAVPRVFNKIHDQLWYKMKDTGGLAYKLFRIGLDSASNIRKAKAKGRLDIGSKVKFKIADTIVYRKIRQRFGGNLSGAMTASAMMNKEVTQFFSDIGLPIFDCYGLTETSPAVTMNCMKDNKPGSVGRPIDQVKVIIDKTYSQLGSDEGEIVVHGPNVMKGYHNLKEATKTAMTPDGGFRTGDQGRIDKDGFLFITGRIKEQYKLENGKYVFPASLEEEIRMVPGVENAMIFGDGRPYNVCLIIPDFEQLNPWAKTKRISTEPAKMIVSPELNTFLSLEITNHLRNRFGGYEIPKSFILIEENFSIENGTLTQTLKLKRLIVAERYRSQIDAAYQEN